MASRAIGAAQALREIATPTTPASGLRLIYAKSDGIYMRSSGGVETPLSGGGGASVVSVTTATTAVANQVVLANGTFTVTVPVTGQVKVKNTGTGTITVAPVSGTIDGAATFPLVTQYASVTVIGDSTNVWVT